jgi:hypothetical protein
MDEPKRYCCGAGDGMFEDNKRGHWIEYSEHKAIVEQLREELFSVSSSLNTSKECNCCYMTMGEHSKTCPQYDKEH